VPHGERKAGTQHTAVNSQHKNLVKQSLERKSHKACINYRLLLWHINTICAPRIRPKQTCESLLKHACATEKETSREGFRACDFVTFEQTNSLNLLSTSHA
jgi:hypothetical protein